tara:strand:- start:2918 stop:3145 length:228 start_codon:yes stop_codon:yes gene_type:complete
MRKMLKEYQNHMGWDNEEAIAILLDYIDNIHLDYDQLDQEKLLQEYLDYAVKEDMRVAAEKYGKELATLLYKKWD